MEEASGVPDVSGVAVEIACDRFSDEGWASTPVRVPIEMQLVVYINHRELVTIQCTPTKLNALVLGFLYAEGIISGMVDVATMRTCEEESLADVTLNEADYELPTKRTITSGCGGGATFRTRQVEPFDSDFVVTPAEILALMKKLQEQIELNQFSGGMHASALCDRENVIVVAGDVGRHNTLDKIQGECLLRGLSTKDRILLTTGRVSSEMLLKAARMQAPVIVSRHSPTGSAVGLAQELGIGLAGHAHVSRLMVYAHPERFGRSVN
jgi:FdhD protein